MSGSIISPNLKNSTKVAAGIDAKTMEIRGCVTDAFLGALWKRLGSKRASLPKNPPDHFERHFPLKSIKMPSKNHPQKTIAKKHGIYRKRLPKCSRIRCRNSSKIDVKTGIEKEQENHENSCFSEKVKP